MSKESKNTSDWAPAVVVPITVAVLGLVGVVIAAIITSQGDAGDNPTITATDERANQTPSKHSPSSVQVISWESREVPPPPQVELVFRGKATGLFDLYDVFILARLSDADKGLAQHGATLGPKGTNYAVSPPAEWSTDGRWTVTWPLPRLPVSAYYTAVLAEVPAIGGEDPPDPVDELRAELSVSGPESWTVKAQEEIYIPRTP
jgi:hypothetical protein